MQLISTTEKLGSLGAGALDQANDKIPPRAFSLLCFDSCYIQQNIASIDQPRDSANRANSAAAIPKIAYSKHPHVSRDSVQTPGRSNQRLHNAMDQAKEYPQLILIGDSIIQYASNLSNGGYHFGAGLTEHCSRRLDVINRGMSGYTSSNILKILPEIIPHPSQAKVDYILLLCGANDACLPGSPSGQHIPLEEYRRNLRAILAHPSVREHNPKILLVTPPIINEVHLESEDFKKGYSALTRHQKVTSQYADVIRDIARELAEQNVVLVDLWTALLNEAIRLTPEYDGDGQLLGSKETGDSKGLRSLLVDGLHLTGNAYKVFLEEVIPHVGASWSKEAFNAPSWIFPHWTVSPKANFEGPNSII